MSIFGFSPVRKHNVAIHQSLFRTTGRIKKSPPQSRDVSVKTQANRKSPLVRRRKDSGGRLTDDRT